MAFFVPPDIVPARIVLLVTLCLVLVNMFNSTTARIPVSNAVTAMEVWLLACMLLVFLSLVEYAVILRRIVLHHRHLERHRREQEREREKPKNGLRHEALSHTELLLQVEEEENGEHKMEGGGECRRRRKKKPKEKWHSQTTAEINLNIFKINLDRGATYLFPFMFFTFNVFYWTFYLIVMPAYAQNNEEDGSEGG